MLGLLLLTALSFFALLPATPARAQQGCFLFFCPPGVTPQGPRNRRPWWAPAPQQRETPRRDQSGSSRSSNTSRSQTRRRAPPPKPDGVVYASAEEAMKGKSEPPTQFVLVLGDRMAAQLAEGLADAYVDDRNRIAVIADTEENTGYLPTPVDWTAKFKNAVAAGKPTATVLALGSNDLQPIRSGDILAQPLTDRWLELYARRVDDVLAALRARAGRVIVLGLAPVEDASVSEEYQRLNELLRSRAARAGFRFVDVWDGFVDEDEHFLTFGPAVDGQRRRLREDDGRFTRAGARKLAFFVQMDLDRMLADPTKPASGLAGAGPERALSLAGGPMDGAKDTAARPTPVALAASEPGKAAARALIDGLPPAPMRGRADDFSWPPPSEAPLAHAPPANAPPAADTSPDAR